MSSKQNGCKRQEPRLAEKMSQLYEALEGCKCLWSRLQLKGKICFYCISFHVPMHADSALAGRVNI